MRDPVSFTSLRFRRFKALPDFSVALGHMNVLVGPNNSGKSTILSAFRVLAAALQHARARNPELQPLYGDAAATVFRTRAFRSR